MGTAIMLELEHTSDFARAGIDLCCAGIQDAFAVSDEL